MKNNITMNKDILFTIILFTVAQILVWLQLNGQFVWPIFKKYESILKDLNVDIAEKIPEGFGSREQYLRALTVANLKPSHKDYSRLVKDFGIGVPTRASKAVLGTEEEEEVVEVERKRGGSVIERNPYNNYEPKAI